MEQEIECCFLCGEPTGKAGAGDDSNYIRWVESPPHLKSQLIGMLYGPLCDPCHQCLTITGFGQ